MKEPLTKFCPICTKDLSVSEFGICRARKDGRNLYCKSCVRDKVKNFRVGRKNWRQVQKERRAKIAEAMLKPEPKPEARVLRLPSDLVLEAIATGSRTQKAIQRETKLTKDEIGNALANLLLWTREIRTKVVDDTRIYFLNETRVSHKFKAKQTGDQITEYAA